MKLTCVDIFNRKKVMLELHRSPHLLEAVLHALNTTRYIDHLYSLKVSREDPSNCSFMHVDIEWLRI
jgi:hypothetical protein